MKILYKALAVAFALMLCATPLLMAAPAVLAAGEITDADSYVNLYYSDDPTTVLASYTFYTEAQFVINETCIELYIDDVYVAQWNSENADFAGIALSLDGELVAVPGATYRVYSNANVYFVFAEEVPAMSDGLYQEAYTLLQTYIFGIDTELTEHMDLTLTLLATFAVLAVVVIPFLLVYLIIRMVTGR